MFQVHDRVELQVVTVFGVHKSGPKDEQTKFLIHDGATWRWEWASRYEPIEAMARRPTVSMPRPRFAVA